MSERKFNPLNVGVGWLDRHPKVKAVYSNVALMVAGVAFLVATVAIGGVLILGWQRADDQAARTMENQHNAVIGCQNANESRQASLALWNFIINISATSNPNATATDKANLAAIQNWIGAIYRPRDCNDLSRKYPIPPPPTLGAH